MTIHAHAHAHLNLYYDARLENPAMFKSGKKTMTKIGMHDVRASLIQ